MCIFSLRSHENVIRLQCVLTYSYGLQDLAESEKTAACTQSLETLRSAWDNKMWCPPPMASRSACVDSASTASGACVYVSSSGSSLRGLSTF